eukprot:13775043-Alexandrium_andersonii.AAC.1
MSASLVGSEMCIRDRPLGSPSSHARRPGASARWHRRPRRRSASGPARAVSYTHLTLPTICSV